MGCSFLLNEKKKKKKELVKLQIQLERKVLLVCCQLNGSLVEEEIDVIACARVSDNFQLKRENCGIAKCCPVRYTYRRYKFMRHGACLRAVPLIIARHFPR